MAKKDTGVIPGLGITEEMRDILSKRDWTKPAHDPKDNPNNWTTQDCERNKFSGFRINELSMRVEIWAAGRLLIHKPLIDVQENPARLADMLEEAFHTTGSLVEVDLPYKTGKLHIKPTKR